MPEFSDRTFSPSADRRWEYEDSLGNQYDQMGDPNASANWNPEEFTSAIQKHLLKQDIDTVIDLNGFTDAQRATVRNYVDALPESAQLRIIRVGF
jgi:hypothetical protein